MKQSKKAENDILSILLKFFLLGCALNVSITSDQTFFSLGVPGIYTRRDKSLLFLNQSGKSP